ncbi:hypothetical protein Q9233_000995 [Columba guinea]|nr:hypothetical protein Q9233_000995 [Columba guinea]
MKMECNQYRSQKLLPYSYNYPLCISAISASSSSHSYHFVPVPKLIGSFASKGPSATPAKEGEGEAAVCLLCVPPKISNISSDITVNEGSNVTLVCMANGRPEPVITWRHLTPTEGYGSLRSVCLIKVVLRTRVLLQPLVMPGAGYLVAVRVKEQYWANTHLGKKAALQDACDKQEPSILVFHKEHP